MSEPIKCNFCQLPAVWWAFIGGEPAFACSKRHRKKLLKKKDYQTDLFPVMRLRRVINEKT